MFHIKWCPCLQDSVISDFHPGQKVRSYLAPPGLFRQVVFQQALVRYRIGDKIYIYLIDYSKNWKDYVLHFLKLMSMGFSFEIIIFPKLISNTQIHM